MRRGARTLLGFDFGKKRIGVAVGQELTETSTPLATLRTVREQPDWRAIGRLVDAWRPQALVVGLPLNMDDSVQAMTHDARRFAAQLEGRYHLPVYFADERLTSLEAARLLRDAPGRRRRRSLDDVAAQLILQTYFSAQKYGVAGDQLKGGET